MNNHLPFSEHREVIAERKVVVPWSTIGAWSKRGRSACIKTPLFDDNAAEAVISVKQRSVPEISERYYSITVEVEGVQDNTDVVIRGQIKWKIRDQEADCANASWSESFTTWTCGNGLLAAMIRVHAYELEATVTVFGPPSQRAAPSMAPLRSLAELSDVTLRAAGRDFAVHRLVLAARSPVLHTMFTSDFKESTDKVVEVAVDCSADVFDAFVGFLYSSALGERNCAELVDLLELGERYMVDQLKEDCVRRLLAMRSEDAFAVLQAALEKPFVPSEVRLRAAQVVRNNWQAVAASNEWRTYAASQPSAALMMETVLSAPGSEAAPSQ